MHVRDAQQQRIADGTPLWHQDSEWSHCLRAALEEWFHKTLTARCGTDRETQARYADALAKAGYEIPAFHEYEAELELDDVLGGVHSALAADDVPENRRDAFADHIACALPAAASFTELVPVAPSSASSTSSGVLSRSVSRFTC
jgi:hypothetical protein